MSLATNIKTKRYKFLVIDDESDIADLVALHLRDLNGTVTVSNNGAEGLALAQDAQWDSIVLDLQLPEVDGTEICRQLRMEGVTTPIIMLTSRGNELDRVLGLELGADDYLTKPFSVRELQARVKAMLRRAQITSRIEEDESKILTLGDLLIDAEKRLVFLAGNGIDLTSTEFDLLFFMANRPGHVFSRTQLLDHVWGYQHSGYEHTVNSTINRLRTKLERDSTKPAYALTVWGVGYKFSQP